MAGDALDTLFLPFEKGLMPFPEGKVLFSGARSHAALSGFSQADCLQPFKPYAENITLYDGDLGAEVYDMALCLLPKQKEEAQYDLARAALSLKRGGVLMSAAANDAGGSRIEKWMGDIGFEVQSLSKHKARVAWGSKNSLSPKIHDWIDAGAVRPVTIEDEVYLSQPGLFGWHRADAGSKLLRAHLPSDLKGAGADFGCGYGYLSRYVLLHNPEVQKLYMIDADSRAVTCAVKNTEGFIVEGIWADLTQPLTGLSSLDFILMNPPFHEGKVSDTAIGQAFICTAAAALKRGGVLHMVANAHLPYEAILKTQFSSVIKTAGKSGFKIFQATR